MTTFLARMRGSGADQTRSEGGASSPLGPSRPIGQWAFTGIAVTSPGGPLAPAATVTAWPLRRVVISIGVILVAVGPVLLINPDRIYDNLITPSLFALWLSQLVTFAVYPRFAARHGGRMLPAWVLAAGASALACYGLWVTIQTSPIGSS